MPTMLVLCLNYAYYVSTMPTMLVLCLLCLLCLYYAYYACTMPLLRLLFLYYTSTMPTMPLLCLYYACYASTMPVLCLLSLFITTLSNYTLHPFATTLTTINNYAANSLQPWYQRLAAKLSTVYNKAINS